MTAPAPAVTRGDPAGDIGPAPSLSPAPLCTMERTAEHWTNWGLVIIASDKSAGEVGEDPFRGATAQPPEPSPRTNDTDPAEAATTVSGRPAILGAETQFLPADLTEKVAPATETRPMPAAPPPPVNANRAAAESVPPAPARQGSAPPAPPARPRQPGVAPVERRSIVPATRTPGLAPPAPMAPTPAAPPAESRPATPPQPPPAPNFGRPHPQAPQALPVAAHSVEPARKSSATLVVAVVILSVLAAASLGTTLFLLTRAGIVSLDAVPGFTAAQDEAQPEAEILFPAPEGAYTFTNVISPSGNIACQLGEEAALCTVFDNNYLYYGVPSCGEGPATLRVDEDGAGLACSAAPVGTDDATELDYGEATTTGPYVCVSREDGMNCWNALTGDSFILARDGWTSGSLGEIPEEEIPWY